MHKSSFTKPGLIQVVPREIRELAVNLKEEDVVAQAVPVWEVCV